MLAYCSAVSGDDDGDGGGNDGGGGGNDGGGCAVKYASHADEQMLSLLAQHEPPEHELPPHEA